MANDNEGISLGFPSRYGMAFKMKNPDVADVSTVMEVVPLESVVRLTRSEKLERSDDFCSM